MLQDLCLECAEKRLFEDEEKEMAAVIAKERELRFKFPPRFTLNLDPAQFVHYNTRGNSRHGRIQPGIHVEQFYPDRGVYIAFQLPPCAVLGQKINLTNNEKSSTSIIVIGVQESTISGSNHGKFIEPKTIWSKEEFEDVVKEANGLVGQFFHRVAPLSRVEVQPDGFCWLYSLAEACGIQLEHAKVISFAQSLNGKSKQLRQTTAFDVDVSKKLLDYILDNWNQGSDDVSTARPVIEAPSPTKNGTWGGVNEFSVFARLAKVRVLVVSRQSLLRAYKGVGLLYPIEIKDRDHCFIDEGKLLQSNIL
jgi:hypothetical protein